MNDPKIGKVNGWKIRSSIRPERDLIAGESPFVRHLWLIRDQLTVLDGVLFKQWLSCKCTQSYLQLVLPSILKQSGWSGGAMVGWLVVLGLTAL